MRTTDNKTIRIHRAHPSAPSREESKHIIQTHNQSVCKNVGAWGHRTHQNNAPIASHGHGILILVLLAPKRASDNNNQKHGTEKHQTNLESGLSAKSNACAIDVPTVSIKRLHFWSRAVTAAVASAVESSAFGRTLILFLWEHNIKEETNIWGRNTTVQTRIINT